MLSYMYDRMVHPTMRVTVHIATVNRLKAWLLLVWERVFSDNVATATVSLRVFRPLNGVALCIWEKGQFHSELGVYGKNELNAALIAIKRYINEHSTHTLTIEIEAVGARYVCNVNPHKPFLVRLKEALF